MIKKRTKLIGVWPLRNSSPQLYTRKAADVIKHKITEKEYIRDEIVLIRASELPMLVEGTDEYIFIYHKGSGETRNLREMVEGIYVNNLLK